MTNKQTTILYLEDNQQLRDSLVRSLTRDGYVVLSAADLPQAEALLTLKPDIILSDFEIGGCNAAGFLAQAEQELPNAHRIILSSTPVNEIRSELNHNGLSIDDVTLIEKDELFPNRLEKTLKACAADVSPNTPGGDNNPPPGSGNRSR